MVSQERRKSRSDPTFPDPTSPARRFGPDGPASYPASPACFHGAYMKKPAKCRLDATICSIWWAQVGSNHRPLPCEGSALPLSYAPENEPEV